MATRTKKSWVPMPSRAPRFDFSGKALETAWEALHRGDLEPWPDLPRARRLLKAAENEAPAGLDATTLAASLQEAWRAFHEGRFQSAFETGVALGPIGASVACKAAGIHATHLLTDESLRLACFEDLAQRAEAAIKALPEEANSHYRHAFALGRYSQGISVVTALKRGLAGQVRDSLQRTLQLAPRHAEARLAFAVYHAEIVAKVGGMIANLTYGARASEAEKHIEAALEQFPASPVTHLEQGKLLLLLHGEKGEDAAAAAFERASQCKPRDAMEWLDARDAASRIE